MKDTSNVKRTTLLLEQPAGTCELALEVVRRDDTLEFYPLSVKSVAGHPSLQLTPSQIIQALRMAEWADLHPEVFTEGRCAGESVDEATNDRTDGPDAEGDDA